MRRRDAHEPQRPPVHAESGYSLLEVLVVIAILGMIVGLVAPAALRQLGGARVSITRQTIERLGSVLDRRPVAVVANAFDTFHVPFEFLGR